MWKAVAEKFSRHLWYLSPENVALAFFDDKVSDTTKVKMVAALKHALNVKNPRRAEVDITRCHNLALDNFVGTETVQFFNRFNIRMEIFEQHPATWKIDQHFQDSVHRLKYLRVINDNAERGVALITEFNDKITHNEEQKQFLLHVVADHRKNVPNATKNNLI